MQDLDYKDNVVMTNSLLKEIEDYLQFYPTKTRRPVFFNMFDENRSAHTDSYGTCLSYTGFLEAFDNSPYTQDQWLAASKEWLENECVGKPLKLIALYLTSDRDLIWKNKCKI